MKEFKVNEFYFLQSGYKHRQNTLVRVIKKTKKFITFNFFDKYSVCGTLPKVTVKISFLAMPNKEITKVSHYGYLDSCVGFQLPH